VAVVSKNTQSLGLSVNDPVHFGGYVRASTLAVLLNEFVIPSSSQTGRMFAIRFPPGHFLLGHIPPYNSPPF